MLSKIHSETVKDEWLDAYGHLNEAYYLVAFSNATWKVQDYLGVGVSYTRESGKALYTAESHIRYLEEVKAGATLDVDSLIIGFDARKIHLGHILKVSEVECATFECVLIHIDTAAGRSCSLPEAALASLDEIRISERPQWSGSKVGMRHGGS